MKTYTEQEVEQFLREQRQICADRAVIDYAEPDKLMLLKFAPEPASFISSKQDVIKSVCGYCGIRENYLKFRWCEKCLIEQKIIEQTVL